MTKKIIAAVAAGAALLAQTSGIYSGTPWTSNWFEWQKVKGDPEAIQLQDHNETIKLRSGGTQTAPALSMRTPHGQGFYLAALPAGAVLSMYRRQNGEAREWLRISYSGIEVADEHGDFRQAFTGKIAPGCAAVVTEGIVTGRDCE